MKGLREFRELEEKIEDDTMFLEIFTEGLESATDEESVNKYKGRVEKLTSRLAENKKIIAQLKSEKYYIDKYLEEVELNEKEDINEPYDNIEGIDAVVGYYIVIYRKEALEAWLHNTLFKEENDRDKEITFKLKLLKRFDTLVY